MAYEKGQDHDGLLDGLDDCAEEGHVFYPGDESALADSIDSYLTRTPSHPLDDDDGPDVREDDGDTPPGDWRCEDCGAINSDLDADCQFCAGETKHDDGILAAETRHYDSDSYHGGSERALLESESDEYWEGLIDGS